MRVHLTDVVEPSVPGGRPLIPFFRLHGQRYQMYWQLTTKAQLAVRKERLAAEERANVVRDANTLDRVAPGEQQSEVEHNLAGAKTESGLHPLPTKVLSGVANDRINIKFSARPGSRAGGVYDVRLMKPTSGPNTVSPGTTSRSVSQ